MSNLMPDPESLSIMVATDSHLGYMERDPVRGKDSFAAFEEVLLLAKEKKVDFVLLGGDLFHENKPSRRTLYRTMDILRRHCMGDEPVGFQVISEQRENFKDRFGRVNYEDPNFSVGLPIFSIHGNHDDPTREGGVEALAALDLLHVANLVNYFGKSNKVDDVEVNPILIQKGMTKLALYGMGNMRDERLNRMWQQKKVKFLRPLEDDGGKDFFNVFVLHQNRDLGRGKKNCVYESMIPEWMDLVIWGHEHECQVDPMDSLVGTFRICQPGSSVATSLCEGEAVPKHVGLLEIRHNDFRMQKIPLSQVRPFQMGDIILSEEDGLDSKGANVDEAVGDALARRVEAMIADLHQEEGKEPREPPEGQEYLVEQRDQVLVRLKVEHSDFPTLNNQRFGSQFMGKVANPSDLLLFYRRRGDGSGGLGTGGSRSKAGGLSEPIRPDNLDDIRVEDLVMENLANADKKLSLLVEPRLKIALEDYVHKGDAQAMNDLVKETLEGAQRALRKTKSAGNAAMIDDAIAKMSDQDRAKLEADRIRNQAAVTSRTLASCPAAASSSSRPAVHGRGSASQGVSGGGSGDGDGMSNDGDDFAAPAAASPAASPAATSRVRRGSGGGVGGAVGRRRGSPRLDGDGVDEEEDRGGGSGGGRGSGRGAGRRGTKQDAVDSEDEVSNNTNDFEEIDDDDGDDLKDEVVAVAPSKRGAAGKGRTARGRGGSRASAAAAKGSDKAAGAGRGGGRRASARGAARGRVRYDDQDGDGDSSEVEEVAPPRKRGRGTQDDDDDAFEDDVGAGSGGEEESEFVEEEVDDDEEEEEDSWKGKGRGRRAPAMGRGKAKTSSARGSASRKAAAPPAPSPRGKRWAAETQQSEEAPSSRKRRLPSWPTSSSRSRRDDDDGEELSSGVSGWGETR